MDMNWCLDVHQQREVRRDQAAPPFSAHEALVLRGDAQGLSGLGLGAKALRLVGLGAERFGVWDILGFRNSGTSKGEAPGGGGEGLWFR